MVDVGGEPVDLWAAMAGVDRLVMKGERAMDDEHRHLARFRGRSPRVLEIGVWGGGSLRMWRNYFGDGATIVGVDIVPRCAEHADPDLGIHVRIGSQADPEFLAALDDELGPFDVVIDDGSHQVQHQIATFEVLWPRLASPGVYVCEDTASSYSQLFGGGRGVDGTFIRRMFEVVDAMHDWFGAEPGDMARTVASVCFYQSLVVVEKDRVGSPTFVGTDGKGPISRKSLDELDWKL